jgi:hypothetical protein
MLPENKRSCLYARTLWASIAKQSRQHTPELVYLLSKPLMSLEDPHTRPSMCHNVGAAVRNETSFFCCLLVEQTINVVSDCCTFSEA